MASTLKIAAGNTAPGWQITCERAGVPINLTGCVVTVIIGKGNVITNPGGACSIINAAQGIVNYVPVANDTKAGGTYKIDVKIVYSDLTYEVLYDQLRVKTRKTIIPVV